MTELLLSVLSMSLTASVVILAVTLARIPLRRAPKKVSYWLWLAVAFRLCCPVSWNSPFSLFSVVPVQIGTEAVAAEETAAAPMSEDVPSPEVPALTEPAPQEEAAAEMPTPADPVRLSELRETAPVSGTARPAADLPSAPSPVVTPPAETPTVSAPESQAADPAVPPQEDGDPTDVPAVRDDLPAPEEPAIPETAPQPILPKILFAASILWLGGVGAMIVYAAASYLSVRRAMATAIRLGEGVYQSDVIRSPFLLGVVRPTIYLPTGVDGDMLRYVLAHERYHIRRGDSAVKLFAFLLLALHWFNPLVWLAFALMTRDMEMSCDEYVLSTEPDIQKSYSYSLLSFASGKRFPSPSPLSFGEGDVKSRIKNVLGWHRPKRWVTVLAILLAVTAAVFCMANPAEKKTPAEAASEDDLFDPAGLEPPLPEDFENSLAVPVPDFLNAEQRDLFLRAEAVFPAFAGAPEILARYSPDEEPETPDAWPEEDGYFPLGGRYAKYADFEAMARSIFTDEYFDYLNTGSLAKPLFLDVDGWTYYLGVGIGGPEVNVAYELIESTSDRLLFRQINRIGNSRPEEDVTAYDVYAAEIEMRRGEDGWRVNAFVTQDGHAIRLDGIESEYLGTESVYPEPPASDPFAPRFVSAELKPSAVHESLAEAEAAHPTCTFPLWAINNTSPDGFSEEVDRWRAQLDSPLVSDSHFLLAIEDIPDLKLSVYNPAAGDSVYWRGECYFIPRSFRLRSADFHILRLDFGVLIWNGPIGSSGSWEAEEEEQRFALFTDRGVWWIKNSPSVTGETLTFDTFDETELSFQRFSNAVLNAEKNAADAVLLAADDPDGFWSDNGTVRFDEDGAPLFGTQAEFPRTVADWVHARSVQFENGFGETGPLWYTADLIRQIDEEANEITARLGEITVSLENVSAEAEKNSLLAERAALSDRMDLVKRAKELAADKQNGLLADWIAETARTSTRPEIEGKIKKLEGQRIQASNDMNNAIVRVAELSESIDRRKALIEDGSAPSEDRISAASELSVFERERDQQTALEERCLNAIRQFGMYISWYEAVLEEMEKNGLGELSDEAVRGLYADMIEARYTYESYQPYGAELGDLDGDGVMELIVYRQPTESTYPLDIYTIEDGEVRAFFSPFDVPRSAGAPDYDVILSSLPASFAVPDSLIGFFRMESGIAILGAYVGSEFNASYRCYQFASIDGALRIRELFSAEWMGEWYYDEAMRNRTFVNGEEIAGGYEAFRTAWDSWVSDFALAYGTVTPCASDEWFITAPGDSYPSPPITSWLRREWQADAFHEKGLFTPEETALVAEQLVTLTMKPEWLTDGDLRSAAGIFKLFGISGTRYGNDYPAVFLDMIHKSDSGYAIYPSDLKRLAVEFAGEPEAEFRIDDYLDNVTGYDPVNGEIYVVPTELPSPRYEAENLTVEVRENGTAARFTLYKTEYTMGYPRELLEKTCLGDWEITFTAQGEGMLPRMRFGPAEATAPTAEEADTLGMNLSRFLQITEFDSASVPFDETIADETGSYFRVTGSDFSSWDGWQAFVRRIFTEEAAERILNDPDAVMKEVGGAAFIRPGAGGGFDPNRYTSIIRPDEGRYVIDIRYAAPSFLDESGEITLTFPLRFENGAWRIAASVSDASRDNLTADGSGTAFSFRFLEPGDLPANVYETVMDFSEYTAAQSSFTINDLAARLLDEAGGRPILLSFSRPDGLAFLLGEIAEGVYTSFGVSGVMYEGAFYPLPAGLPFRDGWFAFDITASGDIRLGTWPPSGNAETTQGFVILHDGRAAWTENDPAVTGETLYIRVDDGLNIREDDGLYYYRVNNRSYILRQDLSSIFQISGLKNGDLFTETGIIGYAADGLPRLVTQTTETVNDFFETQYVKPVLPDGMPYSGFQYVDKRGEMTLEEWEAYLAACHSADGAEPPLFPQTAAMEVPDFLDAEQADLFRRAEQVNAAFCGVSDVIDYVLPPSPDGLISFDDGDDAPLMREGNRYVPLHGRYADWETFQKLGRSLYTEDFWAALSKPYLSSGGRTYVLDSGRGDLPATNAYELIESTSDRLLFRRIVKQFIGPRDEEPTQFTCYGYLIEMVKTADGWRLNMFADSVGRAIGQKGVYLYTEIISADGSGTVKILPYSPVFHGPTDINGLGGTYAPFTIDLPESWHELVTVDVRDGEFPMINFFTGTGTQEDPWEYLFTWIVTSNNIGWDGTKLPGLCFFDDICTFEDASGKLYHLQFALMSGSEEHWTTADGDAQSVIAEYARVLTSLRPNDGYRVVSAEPGSPTVRYWTAYRDIRATFAPAEERMTFNIPVAVPSDNGAVSVPAASFRMPKDTAWTDEVGIRLTFDTDESGATVFSFRLTDSDLLFFSIRAEIIPWQEAAGPIRLLPHERHLKTCEVEANGQIHWCRITASFFDDEERRTISAPDGRSRPFRRLPEDVRIRLMLEAEAVLSSIGPAESDPALTRGNLPGNLASGGHTATDGQHRIYFQNPEDLSLWRMNADGGDPIRLAPERAGSLNVFGGQVIYDNAQDEIRSVPTDGGEPVTLWQAPTGSAYAPHIGKIFAGPDGIWFGARIDAKQRVFHMNLDGSDVREVLTGYTLQGVDGGLVFVSESSGTSNSALYRFEPVSYDPTELVLETIWEGPLFSAVIDEYGIVIHSNLETLTILDRQTFAEIYTARYTYTEYLWAGHGTLFLFGYTGEHGDQWVIRLIDVETGVTSDILTFGDEFFDQEGRTYGITCYDYYRSPDSESVRQAFAAAHPELADRNGQIWMLDSMPMELQFVNGDVWCLGRSAKLLRETGLSLGWIVCDGADGTVPRMGRSSSSDVLPPVNAVSAATSLDELSNLGLDEGDMRLDYIRAFVTGDIDTLEQVCGVEKGMYADYRTLKLSSWAVWIEPDENSGTFLGPLRFAFVPSRSDVEAYPSHIRTEGTVYEGLMGAFFSRSDPSSSFGEAADELYNLLSLYILLDLPTTDEMDAPTRFALSCYICVKLGNTDLTVENIRDYAQKHFGIVNFTPDGAHVGMHGGHGGSHQVLDIIGSEEIGGETVVTVQYYADLSKTVKSLTYRYTMKRIDDGWAFTGSEEIEHAEYERVRWSM